MSIQLKPSEIVARLNEHVIGQETAKKALAVAIYGHFRRMATRRANQPSGPSVAICRQSGEKLSIRRANSRSRVMARLISG